VVHAEVCCDNLATVDPALGEHIGEKLFLPAIAGPFGRDVSIDDWFTRPGT
jgi:hypothetical protein